MALDGTTGWLGTWLSHWSSTIRRASYGTPCGQKKWEKIWRRRKLWTTVYPSKIAPTHLKLWENAFQMIPDISFFDSRQKNPDFLHIFDIFCTCFVLFWRATLFWTPLASSSWKTTPYRPAIIPVWPKKWVPKLCWVPSYLFFSLFLATDGTYGIQLPTGQKKKCLRAEMNEDGSSCTILLPTAARRKKKKKIQAMPQPKK